MRVSFPSITNYGRDALLIRPPQVIVWVTVGEPVFLHIHTCSIFRFSRRPGVYKIRVMAVHRARARAVNAPTAGACGAHAGKIACGAHAGKSPIPDIQMFPHIHAT